jgi:hypothetical protein
LKDHLFFQNDRHLTAISNGRLKLLHRPGAGGTSDCLELYDLYRDPEESQDRYQGSQGYVAPLEAELSSFLTRSVAWQQETSAKRDPAKSDAALSDATRESLEALGYVQEETPARSLPCRSK